MIWMSNTDHKAYYHPARLPERGDFPPFGRRPSVATAKTESLYSCSGRAGIAPGNKYALCRSHRPSCQGTAALSRPDVAEGNNLSARPSGRIPLFAFIKPHVGRGVGATLPGPQEPGGVLITAAAAAAVRRGP